MPIDDFLKDNPPLSEEESKKLLTGFNGTLGLWLDAWGDIHNVPSTRRLDAFITAVDLGYRMAKRDLETDKWNKLIPL